MTPLFELSTLITFGLASAALIPSSSPAAVRMPAWVPACMDRVRTSACPGPGVVILQFTPHGLGFALLGFLGDSLVALLAGRARSRLRESTRWERWRERLTGTILIGLGIRLALLRRH